MSHPVSTNRKTRFSWRRAPVAVLTLGRDYFRPNSSALFPAALIEGNDKDAWKRAALEANGLRSLAALFKQIELDNRKRVVVAGYADDSDNSGGISDRFALSALRARAVLSLLRGDRADFARACYEKHTVEDYQRILKYLALNWQLFFGPGLAQYASCDPGPINGQWGEATQDATRNLVTNHNLFEKTISLNFSLPITGVLRSINGDGQKRWPVQLWEGVYNLYERALGSMLGATRAQLNDRRRNQLNFCDANRRFVACGESFPLESLDDKGKSKYEPKPGRGVEVLLFNQGSLPGKRVSRTMRLLCSPDTAAKHQAKLCPIFYKHHLAATYFDHRAVEITKYYLKFAFYNPVTGSVSDLPAGLPLKAFCQIAGPKELEIDCAVEFADGLYTVTVPDDPQRNNIYFGFKTTDPAHLDHRRWVYTADKDTAPVIVTKTAAEMAALGLADRRKYYDLPAEWSSRNYYTRYGGYLSAGDFYEQLVRSKRLKPYGSENAKADKPMVFSLDDIVLVDGNGRQTIRDKDENDAAQDLSEHSRVTLLYLDELDKCKIKIHKPKSDEPFFSDVEGGFRKNLIHDCWLDPMGKFHSRCRVVVFCSEFYDIYGKRTERAAGFNFNDGHILGARAAKLNDTTASGTKFFSGDVNADVDADYLMPGSGRFDLHYLHDGGFCDGKLHSALVLYWSCRYVVDDAQGGVDEDKPNYIKHGMKNAMVRYAAKDYHFEKLTGTEDIVIKTMSFLEAKQNYDVGGTEIKRGGSHRCLVSLVSDPTGSSISGDTAEFRHSAYKNEPDRFPCTFDDYGGGRPESLTVAHELGHASGIKDDYSYDHAEMYVPRYNQYYPGMPYNDDTMSLMNENHALRLRHFWGFANWINREAKAAAGPDPAGALNGLLKGTQFKLVYPIPPRPGGPGPLSFYMPDAYRNPYKPAYQTDPHEFNTGGNAALFLYKTGDEYAHMLKAGECYNGILIVRHNIFVRFINGGATPAEQWADWDERRQWAEALNSDIKTMLDKKFFLRCGVANNDFAKVYVRVLPHWDAHIGAGGAVPAGTHHTLEVTKNGNDTITVAGSTIKVDDQVINKKIIRRLFGKTMIDADVERAHLDSLATWIGHNSRANAAFTLVEL
jgi:hypothetical protein